MSFVTFDKIKKKRQNFEDIIARSKHASKLIKKKPVVVILKRSYQKSDYRELGFLIYIYIHSLLLYNLVPYERFP